MRASFFLLLFSFAINCNAQQFSLLDCAIIIDTFPESSNVEVYIFFHPHCGYCQMAIDDIGKWSKEKPVHIIAMDLSEDAGVVSQRKTYLEYNIEVRDASKCSKKVRKLIPRIYIVATKTKGYVL